MHKGGETVMADNPIELRKHLAFALAARGRVLVTGLGLGCVLRMLQCNPRVTHITVVEVCEHVIRLVWPHTSHDRVELVQADARKYVAETAERFDCAWHDLWTDTDAGEPHLQLLHNRLLLQLRDRVPLQGAWEYPAKCRRHFLRIPRDVQVRMTFTESDVPELMEA